MYSFDPTYTTNTKLRLEAIEDALTKIWDLLQYVVNKEQMNRLQVIRQKELAIIQSRLEALATNYNDLASKYSDLL